MGVGPPKQFGVTIA